jgi:hypothetical protein
MDLLNRYLPGKAANIAPLEHIKNVSFVLDTGDDDKIMNQSMQHLFALKKGAHIQIVILIWMNGLGHLLGLISLTLDELVRAHYKVTILWESALGLYSEGRERFQLGSRNGTNHSPDSEEIIDRFEDSTATGKRDYPDRKQLEENWQKRIDADVRWTLGQMKEEQKEL